MHTWWITAGALLSLALLGFAQVPSDSPTDEPAPPPAILQVDPNDGVQPVDVIDVTPVPAVPIEPAYQPLVDIAVQDLAARLGLDAATIEAVDATAVVWPDGSLGCPTPGLAYIQVQVEGARIRLRYDKRIYEYHSGGRRAPFLCDLPSVAPGEVPQPPPSRGEGV